MSLLDKAWRLECDIRQLRVALYNRLRDAHDFSENQIAGVDKLVREIVKLAREQGICETAQRSMSFAQTEVRKL